MYFISTKSQLFRLQFKISGMNFNFKTPVFMGCSFMILNVS
jgi:hypothetical protein